MEGLAFIIHLMRVYRRQEESRSHTIEDESDYKESIINLYTSILEYEMMLLAHVSQSSVKGWVKDVFEPTDWTKRAKATQQLDLRCKEIASVITQDENRRWQDELLQQPRREEQRHHIRILYSNYEAGKNVNPDRIAGTCQWFLSHKDFLTWRESQRSELLWLSADPGCGKSVLAKYLVDRGEESMTVNLEPPTVCYFFFKDGDLDRMDGAKALSAILYQLLMQQPELYKYAEDDFRYKNDKFLTDLDALWAILVNAAKDSRISEFICVLDALDECQAHSREGLIRKLVQFYTHLSDDDCNPIIKFLVTSRPEYNIVRNFKALTEVRLRGEEELEQISQEINLVIDYKVEELGEKMDLGVSERSSLRGNLRSVPQRTYLWLYLTFQAIEQQLELTREEIAVIARTIPRSVDEAYTRILNKSPNEERARKLLHIVLAAISPLDLREVNVAMAMGKDNRFYEDLEFWKPEACADKIKNLCGLFVTIADSKVYLIHQTAREFLICQNAISSSMTTVPPSNKWRESFSIEQSHLRLAEICIFYLRLRDFGDDRFTLYDPKIRNGVISIRKSTTNEDIPSKEEIKSKSGGESEEEDLLDGMPDWFRNLCNLGDEFDLETLDGSEEETESEKEIESGSEEETEPEKEIKSESEHKSGLEEETETEEEFKMAGKIGSEAQLIVMGTSYIFLAYAAQYWSIHLRLAETAMDPKLTEIVARQLLNPETHSFNLWSTIHKSFTYEEFPNKASDLILAIYFRQDDVVKFLLGGKDVQVNSQCAQGRTPLSYAAGEGYEDVVKLLLKREDVQADLPNIKRRTPLSYAAQYGYANIVKLLLKREDVQTNLSDIKRRTPLSYAAQYGYANIVKLLLKREDVQTNLSDIKRRTALSYAAEIRCTEVIKLLLERVWIHPISDVRGSAPLLYAITHRDMGAAELLLAYGAELDCVNWADGRGWISLHTASVWSYTSMIDLLLDWGAQVNTRNETGATPLHIASLGFAVWNVELLLKRGADIGVGDRHGYTPLHYAVFAGDEQIVELLLEQGADVNSRSNDGNTSLHKALEREGIVRLLLEHGALVNLRNVHGETPLARAERKGYVPVAKLLREHGARTPSTISSKAGIKTALPLEAPETMGRAYRGFQRSHKGRTSTSTL